MYDFRCKKCNSLLAKEEIVIGKMQIKCYNCNEFNDLDYLSEEVNKLQGVFTADLITV